MTNWLTSINLLCFTWLPRAGRSLCLFPLLSTGSQLRPWPQPSLSSHQELQLGSSHTIHSLPRGVSFLWFAPFPPPSRSCQSCGLSFIASRDGKRQYNRSLYTCQVEAALGSLFELVFSSDQSDWNRCTSWVLLNGRENYSSGIWLVPWILCRQTALPFSP